MKNIRDCHSILLLSRESEDRQAIQTKTLTEYFKDQNKEVFTLLFPDSKLKEQNTYNSDIKVVNKDHLNLFYIPKDSYLEELIKREVDLLIDLSLSEEFTIKYIHALSKARLKVGAAENYKKLYGDMTIDISADPNVSYLIEQVKHYLTNINIQQHVN